MKKFTVTLKKLPVIMLITIALAILACAPASKNVIGTYLYDNSQEQETIVLKSDGTYTWSHLNKLTNQYKRETGTWNYEHIGGPHISLDYVDPENPSKGKGESKPIENWFGVIYLGMDEDGEKLYRKVN